MILKYPKKTCFTATFDQKHTSRPAHSHWFTVEPRRLIPTGSPVKWWGYSMIIFPPLIPRVFRLYNPKN